MNERVWGVGVFGGFGDLICEKSLMPRSFTFITHLFYINLSNKIDYWPLVKDKRRDSLFLLKKVQI
jgi:hypothetical protein